MESVLDEIRRQGVRVTSDDLDEGACSVAAPILNQRGEIEAALSIAGPSARFTAERIEEYTDWHRQPLNGSVSPGLIADTVMAGLEKIY